MTTERIKGEVVVSVSGLTRVPSLVGSTDSPCTHCAFDYAASCPHGAATKNAGYNHPTCLTVDGEELIWIEDTPEGMAAYVAERLTR